MAHENETTEPLAEEEVREKDTVETVEGQPLDVKANEEPEGEVTGVIVDDFDDDSEEKAFSEGTRRVMKPEDEEDEEDEEDLEEDMEGKAPMPMADGEEEEEDDPAERRKRLRQRLLDQLAALDAEEGDEGKGISGDVETKELVDSDARSRRLVNMGYKSEEVASFGDDAFLCAIEKKVMTGGEPCAWCRGGCMPEKGLPGLLDIEAKAEGEYKGIVVDSGYSARDGVFVVDVKTEKYGLIEAFYGDNGAPAGWIKLDDDYEVDGNGQLQGKSAENLLGMKVITVDDAESVATKELPGVSMSISPATFEGYDSYLVEIEGADGKSYDAFVALDGTFLGYDEYELLDEDDDEVKADDVEEDVEVKEYDDDIEFKKFYSAEQRRNFSKRGWSMPDGSFPIKDGQDLKNAIRLAGNSKNPGAARAHIMKRAVQLGLESLIPESWLPKKKGKGVESDGFEKELMEFQMMALENEINDSE